MSEQHTIDADDPGCQLTMQYTWDINCQHRQGGHGVDIETEYETWTAECTGGFLGGSEWLPRNFIEQVFGAKYIADMEELAAQKRMEYAGVAA